VAPSAVKNTAGKLFPITFVKDTLFKLVGRVNPDVAAVNPVTVL
jgi:hypothetical protein